MQTASFGDNLLILLNSKLTELPLLVCCDVLPLVKRNFLGTSRLSVCAAQQLGKGVMLLTAIWFQQWQISNKQSLLTLSYSDMVRRMLSYEILLVMHPTETLQQVTGSKRLVAQASAPVWQKLKRTLQWPGNKHCGRATAGQHGSKTVTFCEYVNGFQNP